MQVKNLKSWFNPVVGKLHLNCRVGRRNGVDEAIFGCNNALPRNRWFVADLRTSHNNRDKSRERNKSCQHPARTIKIRSIRMLDAARNVLMPTGKMDIVA